MEKTATAATKVQEKPNGNGTDIVDLVCADLQDRKALGVKKYGEPLQPFNGRDAMTDLYQELLDASNYCRQLLEQNDNQQGQFISFFSELQRVVHQNAVAKGFWPKEIDNGGEKIALIHAEVSETLEAMRDGNPASNKIPQFSCVEEELADTIIRVLDFAGRHDFDIGGAILAKITYNAGRPYLHGKLF